MRFVIKQVGCGKERVGVLTGFAKSALTVIETPTSALFTQGGSVVHITADVLARIFKNTQLLWLPLSNSIQLENGAKAQGQGVATFAALPEHITCASFNNTTESHPIGHFETDKVPLWTKRGKILITADRYMDIMEVFQPDLILAIADSRTTLSEANKRTSKAVERTCTMLDICVKRCKDSTRLQNSSLIGVIAGTGNIKNCEECVKHILNHKDSIAGVSLAGITNGTEESYNIGTEKLETIFKNIGECIPSDLIHMVEGCWNPAVVVAAIDHGWDVFDGSYPLKLTNAGQALALTFDASQVNDELCILDLNDVRYKEDFSPILPGCECLACTKHTRAYIRHLLNTREMLASVLLSIHNLHHFDQMFVHARRNITSNTFQTFKEHITNQYGRYKTNRESEEAKESEVSDSDVSQSNKKPKIDPDIEQNAING